MVNTLKLHTENKTPKMPKPVKPFFLSSLLEKAISYMPGDPISASIRNPNHKMRIDGLDADELCKLGMAEVKKLDRTDYDLWKSNSAKQTVISNHIRAHALFSGAIETNPDLIGPYLWRAELDLLNAICLPALCARNSLSKAKADNDRYVLVHQADDDIHHAINIAKNVRDRSLHTNIAHLLALDMMLAAGFIFSVIHEFYRPFHYALNTVESAIMNNERDYELPKIDEANMAKMRLTRAQLFFFLKQDPREGYRRIDMQNAALADVSECLKFNTKNAQALNLIGLIKLSLGDDTGAKTDMDHAYSIDPEYFPNFFDYTQTHQRMLHRHSSNMFESINRANQLFRVLAYNNEHTRLETLRELGVDFDGLSNLILQLRPFDTDHPHYLMHS